MTTFTRTLHPETRVVDAARGILDYIASDESIDSYREIIRADGWRFTHFKKNSPFVDSHTYDTVQNLLGRVIDFHIEGRRLVERVQWAIDVPENQLAQLGWKMTAAGYLRAVSVGFWPTRYVTKWDTDRKPWLDQIDALGLDEAESGVRTIYLEQEQVELSSCILGANPNALAKAYKANLLTDQDLETLSLHQSGAPFHPADSRQSVPKSQIANPKSQMREPASSAVDPAVAEKARQQARTAFLLEIHRISQSL